PVKGAILLNIRHPKRVEIKGRPLKSVSPPDGHRIALHHFESALEHRIFLGCASTTTIRICPAEKLVIGLTKSVVHLACRQPFPPAFGQRPNRRPVYLSILIETQRYDLKASVTSEPIFSVVILVLAVEHDCAGIYRI